MPKQGQRAEINSFVKGLITEASELNFPPDAFSDAENFELNRKGTINRRRGMDYEDGAILRTSNLTDININTAKINTFRWLTVGGDVTKDFLVIQMGQKLFFYDLATDPLSAGYQGEVSLTFPESVRYSFASLEGRLVVVAGVDTVAIVSYPSFSAEYNRILTRDVWGLEETIETRYETDPSFRGANNPIHYYNLHNQSWGIPRKEAGGIVVDPSVQYGIDLSVFPSNSEQVWPGLQFQPVSTGQVPFERMYTNLYQEVIGAKVETAKGYFIIDALRRGQSRSEQFDANKAKYGQLQGAGQFKTDLTTGGAGCITDFAGRVFYAGFNGTVQDGDARSPEYSNYVFFSQLVKHKSDFLKCYQEGDPTSRDNADLVDTDGGFIRISGAKSIIALRNLETSLIVLASNGIWSVTGGSDFGFSATNFKATKISSFGAMSESSIVTEGGALYYWSEDGIYRVGRNELGDMGVQNMSLTTIQRYYEGIPNLSKLNAIGSYDLFTKKVRWVFKDGTHFSSGSITRELIFDSQLSAFSVNRIYNTTTNSVEVFSLFRGASFIVNPQGTDVYVGTDQVFAGGDSVLISQQEVSSGIQSTRYLAIKKNGANSYSFTFAQLNNTDWKDWQSVDGIGADAFAYGYTGVQTGGDSAVDKQIPYLVFHMYRTETVTDVEGTPFNQSGCRVRYQWSFANKSVSKKFSPLFQVYRYVKPFFPVNPGDAFDNGFSILTTKNKIRGTGRAFQMYFETQPGKDCQIVGWSITANGNSIT